MSGCNNKVARLRARINGRYIPRAELPSFHSVVVKRNGGISVGVCRGLGAGRRADHCVEYLSRGE